MKTMTLTERLFYEWLLGNGYGKEDIRYNRYGNPDFILSDGRRIEVKRPIENMLYFTAKQWRELRDSDEVAIVHESKKEPIGFVKFAEIKKAHSEGKHVVVGGRKYFVFVDERSCTIIIRCTPETRRRFRILMAEKNFRNTGEALRYLLKLYEKFGSIDVEVFGNE